MLGAIRIEEGTTLEEFLSPKNLKIFQEIEKTLVANDSIEAVATPYNTMVLSDTLIQKAAPTEAQVKQLADGEITAANLPTQALPTTSIAGVSLDTATAAAKADGDTDEAEARDKDFGETATRLLAIPEADRTLDNIEWRKFLLYDNTGAVRESLLPFFPNPQTTQIVTRLKGNMSIELEGDAAVFTTNTIDKAAENLDPAAEVTVIGAPILLKDINDYLRGGILKLGAIAVVAMILILLLLFDVRWRLLPLGVILIGVTWAFGLAGYLGIPLSLVTISGLPVMLGIGIDYAIQMHSRIEEEVLLDREDHPIQEAAVNLGPALLVVTFDAIFAFLALRFAKVPMIRDFGLLLAIGIAVICVVSIIAPLAALGIREYKSPTSSDKDYSEGWLGRFVVKIGSLPSKLAVPFAIGALLIFVGGLLVESSLQIQGDPIDWVNPVSYTHLDVYKRQALFVHRRGDERTGPAVDDRCGDPVDEHAGAVGHHRCLAAGVPAVLAPGDAHVLPRSGHQGGDRHAVGDLRLQHPGASSGRSPLRLARPVCAQRGHLCGLCTHPGVARRVHLLRQPRRSCHPRGSHHRVGGDRDPGDHRSPDRCRHRARPGHPAGRSTRRRSRQPAAPWHGHRHRQRRAGGVGPPAPLLHRRRSLRRRFRALWCPVGPGLVRSRP